MDFIDTLNQRGLIQDASDIDGIRKLSGVSFYCGFDPTAPSLQIGNLVPILSMIHIAQGGLRPIALLGGATGCIGDPSGKSEERNLLTLEKVEQNVENQRKQFLKLFEKLGIEMLVTNNASWTSEKTFLDFLRDVGKYFTVNYMLQKDSVKSRLEGDGISYTEFSYMLIQANDFLHLYENENCRMQVGGSDQWGNITAGLELIRKKIQGEAYAMTFPLITNSQGKKLGKSESGTLWLDPETTSPYRFHQYWLNIEDADVIRFIKTLTFLSLEEIAELEQSVKTSPEKREAQKALADAMCNMIHGEQSTALAKKSAEVLFGGSLDGLSDSQLLDIFADVPSSSISNKKLSAMNAVDLFIETKLAKSKGEAKRLIQNGGAYLNNQRVTDAESTLAGDDLLKSSVLILRTGKKNYHLVKQEQA